ncbi:MAG: UvrD-helicase domain-containing protein, partial [Clostridia bacterium]|nr:UvrD-helicase domain-containing protein [Clostridia bacterium]
VREHFEALELDPAVRVLDEKDAELLREDVLDELVEDWHEREDPGFRELLLAYAPNGDAPVFDMVLALDRLASVQPDRDGWRARAAERYRKARLAWQAARAGEPPEAVAAELGEWLSEAQAYVRAKLLQAARLSRQAAALAAAPGGPYAWWATLAQDVERLLRAAESCASGWQATVAAQKDAARWPRLPRQRADECDADLRERTQALRDRAKDVVKGLADLGLAREVGELASEAAAVAPHAETLLRLAADFAERYEEAKRELAALDFADLEQLTLRLLRDPAVGPELGARFDEVLVDEYQDINACQDAILTSFARRGRLFLVGDVKQSIYRFRLAEPSLFLAKEESSPPLPPDARAPAEEGGLKASGRRSHRVALRENFRSRHAVVDAVNRLFRRIFAPETVGLAYTDEVALVARAPHRDVELRGEGPEVEIHVLESRTLSTMPAREERPLDRREPPDPTQIGLEGEEGDDEDEGVEPTSDLGAPEALVGARGPRDGGAGRGTAPSGRLSFAERARLEREAIWIGHRILELVAGAPGRPPVEVYDPGLERPRPARFGDVAVLLRAAKDEAPVVRDALEGLGVPVSSNAGGYFEAIEVEWALSLLALVDNPLQDIPLASVLRSPLIGLSAGELAAIRLAHPGLPFSEAARRAASGEGELAQKLASFFASLEAWRTEARRRPLVEVVDRIFRDTGLLGVARAMPSGERRARNLAALRARARAFQDSPRPGLFRFVRYIERLRERGDDLTVPPPPGGEDAVRVMTIHQSKGLEFPVVFVANLGGRFREPQGTALVDRDLGLGLPLVDRELGAVFPSLPWVAVRSRIARMERAEEARVLYVALTRARDRLVLVGSVSELADRRLA